MAKETAILGAGGASFPDTPWSSLLALSRRGGPLDAGAVERLARLYWRPVYFWFRYRWNRSPEDAKDLTQDLFASLLSRETAAPPDPSRGRLRVYLKALADNLVRHRARDARRLKRGGGRPLADIGAVDESHVCAPQDQAGCESLYDAAWAKCVVDRALETLLERLRLSGKEAYVDLLRFHDLGDGDPPSYETCAARFRLTVDQVRNHLRYARSLLRGIVREVVNQSVEDPGELDGEYGHLFGKGASRV